MEQKGHMNINNQLFTENSNNPQAKLLEDQITALNIDAVDSKQINNDEIQKRKVYNNIENDNKENQDVFYETKEEAEDDIAKIRARSSDFDSEGNLNINAQQNEPISDDEEKIEQSLEKANDLKNQGNEEFRLGNTDSALEIYDRALKYCPLSDAKLLSILYSNIAVCYLKHKDYESTISYCSKSIEQDKLYIKPYVNRAKAFEQQQKFEDVLSDYKEIQKIDPSYYQIQSLINNAQKLYEEDSKKKLDEVITGAKDIGNKLLGYFGMSLDNFKVNKNEGGSYNIQYQQ